MNKYVYLLSVLSFGALTACNGADNKSMQTLATTAPVESISTPTTFTGGTTGDLSVTTICTPVDNTITQAFTGAGGSVAQLQTGSVENCVTGPNLEVVVHPSSTGSGCIIEAGSGSFDHNMVIVGNTMYQFWTDYGDNACGVPSSRLIRMFNMSQKAGDSTTVSNATPFELTPLAMTYEAYDAGALASGIGEYGTCAPTALNVTSDVSSCSWMGSSIGVPTYDIFSYDTTSHLFSIGYWFELASPGFGSSNSTRFRVLGAEYVLQ